MDLSFSTEEQAFAAEVRDWLAANLEEVPAFASFDEEANLRLGSGITKQDPAFAVEFALRFVPQINDLAQLVDGRLGLYF